MKTSLVSFRTLVIATLFCLGVNALAVAQASTSCMVFSPNGRQIAICVQNKPVTLWNTKDGRLITTLPNTKGTIALAFSPNGKYLLTGNEFSGGKSDTKLFDLKTNKVIKEFSAGSEGISFAAFSPDGKYMLLGNPGDYHVGVWKTADTKLLKNFHVLYGDPARIAISPNSKTMITSSYKSILVWDLSLNKVVYNIKTKKKQETNLLALSPNGKQFAVSFSNKTIKIWHTVSGKLLRTISEENAQITSLVFSPDGKQIIAGLASNNIKLWKTSTGKPIRTLSGHKDGITSLRCLPGGNLLLSIDKNGVAKLWSLKQGKLKLNFGKGKNDIARALLSPNGKQVLTLSLKTKTVRLWHTKTGKLVWESRQ